VAPERLEVPGGVGMDELARMACAPYGWPGDGDLHRYPLIENWTYRVDEAEIDTFLMLRRLMLTAYAGLRHDTELAAQMKASRP
jgi:hypothetical protein